MVPSDNCNIDLHAKRTPFSILVLTSAAALMAVYLSTKGIQHCKVWLCPSVFLVLTYPDPKGLSSSLMFQFVSRSILRLLKCSITTTVSHFPLGQWIFIEPRKLFQSKYLKGATWVHQSRKKPEICMALKAGLDFHSHSGSTLLFSVRKLNRKCALKVWCHFSVPDSRFLCPVR